MLRKTLIAILVLLALLAVAYGLLSIRKTPEHIQYGVSFNTLYARELHLDWQNVYTAILDDLGVRHLRLAAHWTMIEPHKDQYNWSELDIQMGMAKERNADVVLGVGRRLPRWPECHVPEWAWNMTWEEKKAELRDYITAVVNRYKDYPNLTYWQVENEPYLALFAQEHCEPLDEAFLEEEIALVKSLDPSRPVLVTDSGNLGMWYQPYQKGDAFGTSVYVYFWNPDLGPFKSHIPPSFYRVKTTLMQLLFGKKETVLIELSAEPWLVEPVVEVDVATQLDRMNIDKFNDILEFAKKTRFEKQYLWGAEWWYWMREHGHPELWNRAEELY